MRIQIVGTAGAGKSTFAKKLSRALNYRHIGIDDLQFEKDWVKLSDNVFDQRLSKAIRGDHWVACGNYFSSAANIYEKADLIVWLHYPLWKNLWRVTKRTLRRMITKERVCGGNIETFHRQFFSKESIFMWVLTSHKRRVKLFTQMSQADSDKWIVVRNDKDLKACFAYLKTLA